MTAAFLLMSLCFGESLSAQNLAVVGGANFYSTNIKEINSKTMTQWHLGIAYKFDLPVGFEMQPTLLYNVKGANLKFTDVDLSVGYLELAASVQWGVDLILFRPFIDVSPFIGYGLNGGGNLKTLWDEHGKRFEYGVGLGGGLQVWRFQLAAKYNWNFGSLMKGDGLEGAFKDANFSGTTLSVAFFF